MKWNVRAGKRRGCSSSRPGSEECLHAIDEVMSGAIWWRPRQWAAWELVGEGDLRQAAAALWHLQPLLDAAVLVSLRSKALAAAAALWLADRACLQRGPAPTLAVE